MRPTALPRTVTYRRGPVRGWHGGQTPFEHGVAPDLHSEHCRVLNVSAAQIARAIADAARRWTDADFPPRVRTTRALVERTGYTEPVVDYALDRLFECITGDALREAIAGELGSLAALDGFVSRPGRPDVYFRGAARVAIVASDTTIGVAIPALIFALCAKSQVLVKDREDKLVASFAHTLAEEEPALRERMLVDVWNGADETATRAHLGDAQVVVAYGSDEALRAIRTQLVPTARFVPFGHRTSVGYIARESLEDARRTRELARATALDALLYDGEGCLSLHALFVERGGSCDPADFARELARACDELAIQFPPGPRQSDARAMTYRRAAAFRAAQGHGALYGDPAARHLVAYDAPRNEPPPLSSRTIAVYPVAGPTEALAYLQDHALPLEAFACDDDRADIAALAVASGAARIARLGTLQRPPLGGEHGGEGRILPFVRAIYRA